MKQLTLQKLGIAVFTLLATFSSSYAEEITQVKANYALSLSSIPAGRFSLNARFSNDSTYFLDSSVKITGIIGLLVDAEGTLQSSGIIKNGALIPSLYHVKGKIDDKPIELKFIFENGIAVSISGGTGEESIDYIPLEHRSSVVDTLASIILPVLPQKGFFDPENCNRTQNSLGEFVRFYIVYAQSDYRYLTTMYSNLNTFKEAVLVCKKSFNIIGLYNTESALAHDNDSFQDEFWFYPLEDAEILFPVRIKLPRPDGVVSINITDIDIQTHNEH